jgi:hypothetical protein
MEILVKPGVYDAITAGYFAMIRSLPTSSYRIIFEREGMRTYTRNSVYDIEVSKRIGTRDSSKSVLASKYLRPVKC